MSLFQIVAHGTKSAYEPSGGVFNNLSSGTGPTGPDGPTGAVTTPDCIEAIVTTEYAGLADDEFVFSDLSTAINTGNANICVRDGTHMLTTFSGGMLHIMPNATVDGGIITDNSMVNGGGTLADPTINGVNISLENITLNSVMGTVQGSNFNMDSVIFNGSTLSIDVTDIVNIRESQINGGLSMSSTDGNSRYEIHDTKVTGDFVATGGSTKSEVSKSVFGGTIQVDAVLTDYRFIDNNVAGDVQMGYGTNLKITGNNFASNFTVTGAPGNSWSGIFANNSVLNFVHPVSVQGWASFRNNIFRSSTFTGDDYNGIMFSNNRVLGGNLEFGSSGSPITNAQRLMIKGNDIRQNVEIYASTISGLINDNLVSVNFIADADTISSLSVANNSTVAPSTFQIGNANSSIDYLSINKNVLDNLGSANMEIKFNKLSFSVVNSNSIPNNTDIVFDGPNAITELTVHGNTCNQIRATTLQTSPDIAVTGNSVNVTTSNLPQFVNRN